MSTSIHSSSLDCFGLFSSCITVLNDFSSSYTSLLPSSPRMGPSFGAQMHSIFAFVSGSDSVFLSILNQLWIIPIIYLFSFLSCGLFIHQWIIFPTYTPLFNSCINDSCSYFVCLCNCSLTLLSSSFNCVIYASLSSWLIFMPTSLASLPLFLWTFVEPFSWLFVFIFTFFSSHFCEVFFVHLWATTKLILYIIASFWLLETPTQASSELMLLVFLVPSLELFFIVLPALSVELPLS